MGRYSASSCVYPQRASQAALTATTLCGALAVVMTTAACCSCRAAAHVKGKGRRGWACVQFSRAALKSDSGLAKVRVSDHASCCCWWCTVAVCKVRRWGAALKSDSGLAKLSVSDHGCWCKARRWGRVQAKTPAFAVVDEAKRERRTKGLDVKREAVNRRLMMMINE
eukprot:scaffold4396_cov204-Amphora_coffeaeformis.AAC.4